MSLRAVCVLGWVGLGWYGLPREAERTQPLFPRGVECVSVSKYVPRGATGSQVAGGSPSAAPILDLSQRKQYLLWW